MSEGAAVPTPCEQKDNIQRLFDLHGADQDKLREVEVRQIEIAGDIKHIKSRIDNGMGETIHKIHETLTKLEPIIAQHALVISVLAKEQIVAKSAHHAKIVGKIEDIGWWVSKLVIAALLVVLVWAIANGAHVTQVIK